MVQKRKFDKISKSHAKVERKILVAVDFGCTFTGIAWAQTRKHEVHNLIIQWPDATSGGLEGVTSDKVPTEIQYDGSNLKWGSQIPGYGPRHQWFKLGLDTTSGRAESALPAQYQDPLAVPADYMGNELSPQKLTTDFLKCVRQHTEIVLKDKVSPVALESTPIEYVITVPAVWSDGAQEKTRLCAEEAGMGAGAALHIISEPEAAAMYALEIMEPHGIKVGDTFMLCDAGGGTVDLITYTVAALKPRLKITEASTGSGSLCGSSYLNKRFQSFLQEKIGHLVDWDSEVEEEALKCFENEVKRKFRGTFGEHFFVPVSGMRDNAEHGIRRGKLRIDGVKVRNIFEPVLEEVHKLLLGQIRGCKTPVQAIVLVGGFGQNSYLRDSLRAAVADKSIEVRQSPNAWTAVVRGALIKGLAETSPAFAKVKISGRLARKHYGTAISIPYQHGVHDIWRRYWSDFKGRHMVSIMSWFITKGTIVEEQTPQRHKYTIHSPTTGSLANAADTSILISSDPYNTGAPSYPSDTQRLVVVKADLDRLPRDSFPTQMGADGKMYYMIEIEIEVTFFSAYTKYELIHAGVNYGLVSTEYV